MADVIPFQKEKISSIDQLKEHIDSCEWGQFIFYGHNKSNDTYTYYEGRMEDFVKMAGMLESAKIDLLTKDFYKMMEDFYDN